MCLEHVLQDYGIDHYVKVKRKLIIAKKVGKSKNYINRLLKQGCPRGQKRCNVCGIPNGRKSKGKGKGKGKNKENLRW